MDGMVIIGHWSSKSTFGANKLRKDIFWFPPRPSCCLFSKLVYDAAINKKSVAKSNQNFLVEGAIDFSLHITQQQCFKTQKWTLYSYIQTNLIQEKRSAGLTKSLKWQCWLLRMSLYNFWILPRLSNSCSRIFFSALCFVLLIGKAALNMGDADGFGFTDSQSLCRTNMTNILYIIQIHKYCFFFFKYRLFILSENEELARMAASPKLS